MSPTPSEQILTRIAEKRGVDVVELPPLYDTVDPERLDDVVQSLDDGRVSFTYADFDITVTSEEEITISKPVLAEHQ